ncbi:MAG: hypothetical protein EXQ64_03275 [Ilumatobacteraceae bacterium]|nr:hypothetical protein [Ilumatobacteraceae bacterium]
MKKGRHRRFEEARKLKQAGPSAADLGLGSPDRPSSRSQDDEYAEIAERYGVRFDDEDEVTEDTE